MRSALPILSLVLVAASASTALAGDIIVLHSGKTMGTRNASDPPKTATHWLNHSGMKPIRVMFPTSS